MRSSEARDKYKLNLGDLLIYFSKRAKANKLNRMNMEIARVYFMRDKKNKCMNTFAHRIYNITLIPIAVVKRSKI